MRGRNLPDFITVSPEIGEALSSSAPIVALESAVISHGLPHPAGIETAAALEDEVRKLRAIPATIMVRAGQVIVGAGRDDLPRLTEPTAWKIAERDIPVAVAARATGGTTVAGTIAVAEAAGIHVMSTGGIGGVHLEAARTWDVSADLLALSRHSMIVVCSGAKAICDIPKTLEYLDTLGVTVTAFGADRFPNFYAIDSGLPAPRRVDEPRDAAAILAAKRRLGQPGAVLVANPVPHESALSADLVRKAVAHALTRARGSSGGDRTPALLRALNDITAGRTLQANIALLRANAQLAALIAREVAKESFSG